MGARTTWEIRQYSDSPAIYLYSHWGGDSKWSDTAAALAAAEPRWSDPSYATRIFISQIVGREWDQETGFGIVAGPENECPFEEEYFSMVIDFSSSQVITGQRIFTFEDFLKSEDFSEDEVTEFWNENA